MTIWCGLWSAGFIGLYLFENEDSVTIIANRITYVINDIHTSHDTWRQTFDGRLIRRNGDVWLTPLDYFPEGLVKEKCYPDKPETFEQQSKVNIHDAVAGY